MRLFKKKAFKEIDGAVWGYFFNEHKINVDTISKDLRCVEREGVLGREKASDISSYL